ncbi:Exo-beta-1,3-glucanase [Gammaproteobacteria bacterium]
MDTIDGKYVLTIRKNTYLVIAFFALVHLVLWAALCPSCSAVFTKTFPSVSFAPYRHGQSPLLERYPTLSEIEEDIANLAEVPRALAIRTYSSRGGLEQVPNLAQKYGLVLYQGAWLSSPHRPDGIPTSNDLEISSAIRLANAYPKAIRRVIVGNEVLLRGELTPKQLIEYIHRVKSSISQPVTYADVWAFFEKYPEVGRAVDILTIHILPYWEDEPISSKEAINHVLWVYQRMQSLFPGKPIFIGEIGWPTQGRSRGSAEPSLRNSVEFANAVNTLAKEKGFDFNWVEAFDQSWKSQTEGTVGANWGVLNEDRHLKIKGCVLLAYVAMLLGVVLAIFGQDKHWRNVAFAQLLGALVLIQADYVLSIAYTPLEIAWAWLRILSYCLFTGLLWRVNQKKQQAARGFLSLYVLAALFNTLLLLLDGRYRDISTLEFLLPSIGVLAYALTTSPSLSWKSFSLSRIFPGKSTYDPISPKRASILLITAMAIGPLSESWALSQGTDFLRLHSTWADRVPLLLNALVANQEMLGWSAVLGCMAIPYLLEWNSFRRAVDKVYVS